MPYHIKTPGKLEVGDVYYKGGNNWTSTYADRKQYSNKSDADAKAAYKDRVTKGVWFYDKKGKGHIRDGKKVYS